MDEELRRIRAEEKLADSVYASFPSQSLKRSEPKIEQPRAVSAPCPIFPEDWE